MFSISHFYSEVTESKVSFYLGSKHAGISEANWSRYGGMVSLPTQSQYFSRQSCS